MKPKIASQPKVWHLYAIVGVLFGGLALSASLNLYWQTSANQSFQELVRVESPASAKAGDAPVSEVPAVYGAETEQSCSPCLKKELNNRVATLSAQAVLLGDLQSGEIFARKNIKRKLPIASLTKLMTALVVLDRLPLSQVVATPPSCAQLPAGQQRLGLVAGQELTVEELLYGLLARSGADCACSLAEAFGGEEELVSAMNRKADALRLTATHFQNPVGNDSAENYSTAQNLFLLTQEAMNNPVLRKIVGSKYFQGAPNTNKLLFRLNGITGVKTGYTDQAGECLIATWLDGDREYLGIVLGSADRFADASFLFRLSQEVF